MEIYSNRNIGHSQSLQSQNQRLDNLLRHIQQEEPKKNNDENRIETDEMDKQEIQNRLSKNGQETRTDKTRKPKTILSLADRLLLKLLLNNTSRMTGDCHVRFCERLGGETPPCLLGASAVNSSNFQCLMIDSGNENQYHP